MACTGRDRMASLMALLSVGLSVGSSISRQTGTFPRPALWVEPDSLVPVGSSVTFWCQGPSGTQEFRLDKTGSSSPWSMQFSLESGDKAKFSVPYITEEHAGTYDCSYPSPSGWSERSDLLELVVTGIFSKPSLSVLPSPIVALGGTVTLQCDSNHGFNTFVLTQGGDPETPRKLDSQQLPSGHFQALFHVGPVKPGRRWSFRCYGFFSHTPQRWSHPSDPLQLLVSGPPGDPSSFPTNLELKTGGDARGPLSSGPGGTQCQGSEGTLPRPALWVEPDSLVPVGSSVTFWCQGTSGTQEFRLDKTGSSSPWIMQFSLESRDKAKFSVPSITEEHAGTYDCSYLSPAGWSERSDTLELMITGIFSKPSLSVLPSPVVASGGTVTLQCDSYRGFDTFVLTQWGDPETPRKLHSQQLPSGHFQALFHVGPVKPGPRWSFRCYGFFSHTPQRWSHPSDPLQLLVSGPPGDPSPLPTNLELTTGEDARGPLSSGPGGTQCQGSEGPQGSLHLLLWVSIISVLLLILLLFFILCRQYLSRSRRSDASGTFSQPEENNGRNSPAAAPESSQKVIYSELKHLDPAQETTVTPSSLSGGPPEKPNVYAALTFH